MTPTPICSFTVLLIPLFESLFAEAEGADVGEDDEELDDEITGVADVCSEVVDVATEMCVTSNVFDALLGSVVVLVIVLGLKLVWEVTVDDAPAAGAVIFMNWLWA